MMWLTSCFSSQFIVRKVKIFGYLAASCKAWRPMKNKPSKLPLTTGWGYGFISAVISSVFVGSIYDKIESNYSAHRDIPPGWVKTVLIIFEIILALVVGIAVVVAVRRISRPVILEESEKNIDSNKSSSTDG